MNRFITGWICCGKKFARWVLKAWCFKATSTHNRSVFVNLPAEEPALVVKDGQQDAIYTQKNSYWQTTNCNDVSFRCNQQCQTRNEILWQELLLITSHQNRRALEVTHLKWLKLEMLWIADWSLKDFVSTKLVLENIPLAYSVNIFIIHSFI